MSARIRGVAQSGSALALGARCRRFESSHPDLKYYQVNYCASLSEFISFAVRRDVMEKYRFFILTAFLIVLSSLTYSADTVIIRDTVYVFDSTKAVATSVAELKAEFYERAIKGLEREKSSTNTLITLIGIIIALLTSATGYAAYSAKKSREEVDREIDRIRGQRDTIDKEVLITRELRVSVEREAGELRNKTDEIRKRIDKESEEIHSELKIFRSEIDETRAMLDKVIEEKTGQFDELLRSAELSSKEIDKITEGAKKDQIVSPEKIAELIESPDARKFIDEYEQIVTKYQEIDALQSLPSKLHETAGMSYVHLKKYKEALFAFQRYLYIIPGDTKANFYCAFCLAELSQFDEAIRYNSMAVITDPENRLGYNASLFYNWGASLGKLYDIRKEEQLLEQALVKFEEATEIDDKYESAYIFWGNALVRLYDLRKDDSLFHLAIKMYKQAVEINDQSYLAYYNWGLVLILLHSIRKEESVLHQAIEMFEKAVGIDDQHASAYHNWGTALSQLYDVRKDESLLHEAIEKYKKAVAINDKHEDAYYNWGTTLVNLYKISKSEDLLSSALVKFEKLFELNPESGDSHYGIAWVHSLRGQKEQMLGALEKSISLDPENAAIALEGEDFEAYKNDSDFLALVKPSKDDKNSKDKSNN